MCDTGEQTEAGETAAASGPMFYSFPPSAGTLVGLSIFFLLGRKERQEKESGVCKEAKKGSDNKRRTRRHPIFELQPDRLCNSRLTVLYLASRTGAVTPPPHCWSGPSTFACAANTSAMTLQRNYRLRRRTGASRSERPTTGEGRERKKRGKLESFLVRN